MSPKREPIEELAGKTIESATFVDGDIWFDIEIVTTDGLTITSGGYKADAAASLYRGDDILSQWDW